MGAAEGLALTGSRLHGSISSSYAINFSMSPKMMGPNFKRVSFSFPEIPINNLLLFVEIFALISRAN